MAEEENKEEEQQAPQKSGGGKGLMIALIVVVVLLLAAVAGGGYYMYSQGMFNQNQEKQEEVEEEDDSPKNANFTAKFENIVLNITKNNGRNALMKLAFTFKSKEETIAERAEENSAEIMDAVISIISTKTAEELRTLGGKEILKEEMIVAINDILNENITEDNEETSIRDSIQKLFFVNFVIK